MGAFLKQCAKLALTVYVVPSITNEVHSTLKAKADEDAIKVFAENVSRYGLWQDDLFKLHEAMNAAASKK